MAEMTKEYVKSSPDFVPGSWINYSPSQMDEATHTFDAHWNEYFRIRREMFGRGSVGILEATRRFGAAITAMETTFAEFRGCPVIGAYEMPSFYDSYDQDSLPRSAKFIGDAGFRYNKPFRALLGRLSIEDVEHTYKNEADVPVQRVINDELLLALWPLRFLHLEKAQLLEIQSDAVQLNHAFSMKEFAGNVALVPPHQIAEIHIMRSRTA